VFLPLHRLHWFEFSSEIQWWKQEAYFLLVSWNPRQLSGFLGDLQLSVEIFPSFVVPPWRFLGDLQLSFGDLPKLCGASVAILGSLQLICGDCPKLYTGSVTSLKCPTVIGSSILVGRLEEITVSLQGIWGALCLHTDLTEISTHKGVNFGIHHRLRMPLLFLYLSSFTYAIYFVIDIVLEVIYILLSHSCLSCLA
jgi:hypothetical protein